MKVSLRQMRRIGPRPDLSSMEELMPRYSATTAFRNRVIALAALLVCSWLPAAAEQKDIRIMLDWIIQGTHAPFFVAQTRGYFKEQGLTVALDAGKGATNTAVNVASNVYQFGWVDLPTMIKFNAQNPGSPLIAVYMSFDETPLAVVTLKSKGITKPADLDGKKIAGGPGTAVHDTISILLKSAHAQSAKIQWVAVSPQLFGPMLARGEVDGIGGFTNSQIPAAMDVGFKFEDIYAIKYSDFGADLYGLALVTTKKFAEENPGTVRGVVWALNRGTIDTISAPDQALAVMKRQDPMMKTDVETVRLKISLGHTYTPYVAQNGLSSVQPARLQKTIDSIVSAYELPNAPKGEDVYTDKFLPPAAERMVPKK